MSLNQEMRLIRAVRADQNSKDTGCKTYIDSLFVMRLFDRFAPLCGSFASVFWSFMSLFGGFASLIVLHLFAVILCPLTLLYAVIFCNIKILIRAAIK